MERTLTYFLSDFHLGAKYLRDARESEIRIVKFLDSIKHTAKEIYLLGDILDYWFEYRYVVPRGYVRFFGKLAELADLGVEIHWFTGNHDIWIFDYLPQELGIEIVRQATVREIDGHRFFLSHGDDVGKLPLSFRFLRAIFHSRLLQRLYASLNPWLTIPFALGWSRQSRCSHENESPKMVIQEKDTSENVANLLEFVANHSNQNPQIDYYVFGHYHVADEKMVNEKKVVFLGDWISKFTYATFDGVNLQLNKSE